MCVRVRACACVCVRVRACACVCVRVRACAPPGGSAQRDAHGMLVLCACLSGCTRLGGRTHRPNDSLGLVVREPKDVLVGRLWVHAVRAVHFARTKQAADGDLLVPA